LHESVRAARPEDHDPEALARLLDDLRDHVSATRRALEEEAAQAQARAALASTSQQPLRLVVLDALADLGYPTVSPTLGAFVAARFGREIPASQFGTLAVQERAIVRRAGPEARPVWLASGLTLDGFRPVKRIWARSDWPLRWRIITPTSSRLQQFHVTEALCRLALQADTEAQDPAALRALALGHAQDLPGVVVDRQDPDFARYAALAHTLFEELEPDDLRERLEAAETLRTLPVQTQLFGQEAGEAEGKSRARGS
jgi:hypothetical protein